MTKLGDVLQAVAKKIRSYVVMAPEQVDAVSLWVAHTYAFAAADSTPYLNVNSPTVESGKTRLLEFLEFVVARPWYTGRVTAAVLARKTARETPTLLLDETDAAFKSGDEYAETLRGVLNTGYRRGGKTSLCVGKGAEMDYVDLSTFSPKAFAGLKKLPDTVESRSVPIRLKRRTMGEAIRKFRRREVEVDTAPLRQWLEEWAREAVPLLREARPEVPETLGDRAADCWEPLLAIADLAGGEWSGRARHAAVMLYDQGKDARESYGELLLAAIRDLFAGTDRLATADMLRGLVDRDDGPWAEWWGKAVAAGDSRGPGYKLAKMLKPYGIVPNSIRVDGATPKGYLLEDFADVFLRYLSPPSPNDATQETTPHDMTVAGAARGVVASVASFPGDSNGELHPLVRTAREVFAAQVLE